MVTLNRLLCIVTLAFVGANAFSQAYSDIDSVAVDLFDEEDSVMVDEEPVNNNVYDTVDQMPQFPGGATGLFECIAQNMKYPKEAEEHGIQGRVVLTMIIEQDGRVDNIRVVKSVHPLLDKEAIRVIKFLPKWLPGRKNGVPVRVKYTIPITFKLG